MPVGKITETKTLLLTKTQSIRVREMQFYKIKSYFPQPVQGAGNTTLLYFYQN